MGHNATSMLLFLVIGGAVGAAVEREVTAMQCPKAKHPVHAKCSVNVCPRSHASAVHRARLIHFVWASNVLQSCGHDRSMHQHQATLVPITDSSSALTEARVSCWMISGGSFGGKL
jgi:hypothetical protein